MSKTEILRHSLRNITQILNNMENLRNSGKKQKPINYRLWRSTKFCKDATKAFKYCMGKCTNMRSTKRQDNRFLVHARKGSGWNKRGKKKRRLKEDPLIAKMIQFPKKAVWLHNYVQIYQTTWCKDLYNSKGSVEGSCKANS